MAAVVKVPPWRCPYGGVVVSACRLPRGHDGDHKRRQCRVCWRYQIEGVPPKCRACGAGYSEEHREPPR